MKNEQLAQVFAQISDLYAEAAVLMSEGTKEEAKVEEKPKAKSAPKKEKPAEKAEKKTVEKKTESGEKTEEELNEMSFNALKKYAKEVGVPATGKRDDIIARILGGEEEPKKAEKPKQEKSKVVSLEEKKEEKAEYEALADELLDENEVDDIISELKSVGLKGITKKNVRKKLIEALKKDLLDLGDDEEEEEVEDDDDEVIDENYYFEAYDAEDEPNNPDNVKEQDRLDAMIELQKDILADVEEEDLSVADMKAFLLDNSTEDEKVEIEQFDEDEILACYCELRKRMIDDDGEDYSDHADDPYFVNGEIYCYGHKCVLKDGEYFDEVGEESFQLDDEE